jgi:hypothetical protein
MPLGNGYLPSTELTASASELRAVDDPIVTKVLMLSPFSTSQSHMICLFKEYLTRLLTVRPTVNKPRREE